MSTIGTLTPPPYLTIFDNSGIMAPGALLYSYLSGTSTPSVTYTDAALSVPNTNPAVADSAGRIVAYLDPGIGSYKFIVKLSDGTTLRTVDPVAATNAGTVGLGETFVFGSNSSSPVTATNYPSGATFDKLHPGTSVYQVNSANLTGTYVLEVTGLQVTSGTMTVALVNLSDGTPDTPLVTCAITSTTGQVVQSSAIAFGASGSTKSYGIKAKVSANSGFIIGARIMRTA